MKNFLTVYSNPRIVAILLLGFASGLPLALTASSLFAWLKDAHIDNTSIGLFAAVGLPYSLKFLWSPLMDGTSFPVFSKLLGRRRGWLLGTQLLVMLAILLLGIADPATDPWRIALFALVLAFLSASQDIVIDAFRVESLSAEDQGLGSTAIQAGYRFGMLASGAGALALADIVSWRATYFIMASLMLVGVATTLLSPEPAVSAAVQPKDNWFKEHILDPFLDFMQRPHWLTILCFIALYKLGDAFLGVMTNPFLLEIGFTKTQISHIVKIYGLIATLIGLGAGTWMMDRLGMFKTLMLCGFGHAVTNLMFLVQAHVGADPLVLTLGIFLENLSGGMTAAAFVAFLSRLTHVRYTATQYALLSSLAAVGRTLFTTSAGWTADHFGWQMFFIISVLLALPGLVLLLYLSKVTPSSRI